MKKIPNLHLQYQQVMRRIIVLASLALAITACNRTQDHEKNAKLFSFERTYYYPGTPDFVYDHLTGDITGWWDHSFSGHPYKMYIDPKPGGGFYEIFDESGDGILHATVTGAKRGKLLRMEGPLGLAGIAVTFVTTYRLEPQGTDSTKLVLNVNAAGDVGNDIPDIVSKVWYHFLEERFRPYISGLTEKTVE